MVKETTCQCANLQQKFCQKSSYSKTDIRNVILYKSSQSLETEWHSLTIESTVKETNETIMSLGKLQQNLHVSL